MWKFVFSLCCIIFAWWSIIAFTPIMEYDLITRTILGALTGVVVGCLAEVVFDKWIKK